MHGSSQLPAPSSHHPPPACNTPKLQKRTISVAAPTSSVPLFRQSLCPAPACPSHFVERVPEANNMHAAWVRLSHRCFGFFRPSALERAQWHSTYILACDYCQQVESKLQNLIIR